MEENSVNDVSIQSNSDSKDREEQNSSFSCSSVKVESSTDCIDLKHSDVVLVSSPSTSGSGQDSSARRKTSGGNGQTRKEKLTPPNNSKGSTKKINKFWNFLSKKKLSTEVDKRDLKKVSDECADEPSMMVSCLCTGLRRLHFPLRVVDEEMAASDCIMGDDDNDTADIIISCQSNGLSSAEGSNVPDEYRMHRVPPSAQRHSLPANPSLSCSDVEVDDVTKLLRSMTRQEDGVATTFGHRATYPHLSYGAGSSSSLASSAAAATASDARCSSHTRTINSRTFETHPVPSSFKVNEDLFPDGQSSELKLNIGFIPQTIHTQVDYIHCLVPDLKKITSCSYYWGIMDRYEAERLLDNRPEGTFLLRDSAQEEFLFSVSFRRYSRSLHARVEQWNHKFSFDSHDPSVYASLSVCGLVEHYKDPACCMFFEPMLTLPLVRTFPFSLQHLCRAAICSMTTYDGISYLPLPKSLHQFLQYYHYKQKVRVRRFETLHT